MTVGSRLRVWIVSVGETLPTDEGVSRRFRMGMLAQTLADRGHDVTYWSSGFNHYRREQRTGVGRRRQVGRGASWDLILVPTPSYGRSIGVRRILNHKSLGIGFRRMARVAEQPDIVVACMPIIELAHETSSYCRERGLPYVVDVRDLHPDVIYDRLPGWSHGPLKAAMRPLYDKLNEAFSGSAAIWGITPDFVEWGLEHGGRKRNAEDRDYPLASDPQLPDADDVAKAAREWERLGVHLDEEVTRVSFVGQMSRHLPLDDVLDAAQEVEGAPIQFVLAGAGPNEARYRSRAAELRNVVMPGWIDRPLVWTLLQRTCVGLAPYVRDPSFQASLPNKAIEYLSTGVPVLTTLDGRLGRLLESAEAGWVYEPGDPAGLAATLRRVAGRDSVLRSAQEGAQRVYRERFDPERIYGEMADSVERLGRARR